MIAACHKTELLRFQHCFVISLVVRNMELCMLFTACGENAPLGILRCGDPSFSSARTHKRSHFMLEQERKPR
jgi:hypothetical protein